jgi:hypothetical protein
MEYFIGYIILVLIVIVLLKICYNFKLFRMRHNADYVPLVTGVIIPIFGLVGVVIMIISKGLEILFPVED